MKCLHFCGEQKKTHTTQPSMKLHLFELDKDKPRFTYIFQLVFKFFFLLIDCEFQDMNFFTHYNP